MPLLLDHLVINVRFEMDRAVDLFSGLGFTVTPRGHHTLGSINHLIVFGENYLELLGLPQGAGHLRQELLDSPAGLDGLVFASADPEATLAALTRAGFQALPVQRFSRPVVLGGDTHEARFQAVRLAPGQFAAGRVYFCHHETPGLVWRPEWRRHANGTDAITALTAVSAAPRRTQDAYARLGGIDAGFGFDVVDAATLAQDLGTLSAIGAGRPERFAVARLRTAALAEIAERAAHLGLPRQHEAGRVLVGLPMFDTVLEFRP